MAFLIGLAVGLGAALLAQRLKARRHRVHRLAVQKRQQHEYRNFLQYNGEKQEDYHGND